MGDMRKLNNNRKSFDYDAAIQAMKSIHPSLATEAMVQWNQTLIEEKTQGEELYAEIKTLLASKKYAGLLSKVDRLIELRGPKDSLATLKGKLIKREASIAKQTEGIRLEAQRLFSTGDLTAASNLLERIAMERRNDEDLQLAQQLAIASPFLDQIREFVSQSKSDFDNFSSSVPRFLALVVQYLEVVPTHDQINQLKKGLIKRISENYQNYYTRETDIGFAEIPVEIRLLIPSDLLNTYIKNRDDVKVFVREAQLRTNGTSNIACSVCWVEMNLKNYVKHFDKLHSASADEPSQQDNPQRDLLLAQQEKIAEEAHESGEATLEFTITDDQIENQFLSGKLTVINRSPYDVHNLMLSLVVLNEKRSVGEFFNTVTHLPPGQVHTWDIISHLDSNDYDRFEFKDIMTINIKDQNGRELPDDSIQMKINYNSA